MLRNLFSADGAPDAHPPLEKTLMKKAERAARAARSRSVGALAGTATAPPPRPHRLEPTP
jgi:hypothetical protein